MPSDEEEQYFTIDDLLAEEGDTSQAAGAIGEARGRSASTQTTTAWHNHLRGGTGSRKDSFVELAASQAPSAAAVAQSLRTEVAQARARAERAEARATELRAEQDRLLDALAADAGRQRARAENK